MFRKTYQHGFLSILYSCGSSPLELWGMHVSFPRLALSYKIKIKDIREKWTYSFSNVVLNLQMNKHNQHIYRYLVYQLIR
jgi:hypothetical protein